MSFLVVFGRFLAFFGLDIAKKSPLRYTSCVTKLYIAKGVFWERAFALFPYRIWIIPQISKICKCYVMWGEMVAFAHGRSTKWRTNCYPSRIKR